MRGLPEREMTMTETSVLKRVRRNARILVADILLNWGERLLPAKGLEMTKLLICEARLQALRSVEMHK